MPGRIAYLYTNSWLTEIAKSLRLIDLAGISVEKLRIWSAVHESSTLDCFARHLASKSVAAFS